MPNHRFHKVREMAQSYPTSSLDQVKALQTPYHYSAPACWGCCRIWPSASPATRNQQHKRKIRKESSEKKGTVIQKTQAEQEA